MSLTLLLKIVVCLSVQSSLGVDLRGAEDHTFLKYEHGVPIPNDEAALASTSVQNDKVCDEAVTLQNVLGVMVTMLRQDLPRSSKTTYLVETLKDVLRNRGELNDEVKQKMDDLMRTLDKYKNVGHHNTLLRLNRNTDRIPMDYLDRQSLTPFQKIKFGYELPVLTNRYCTEALLSIIKIAYQAYESLAKNPICNLPELPQPLQGAKPESLLVSDFTNVSPSQDLQPEIWDSFLPKTKFPFLASDDGILHSKLPHYEPAFEYLPAKSNPVNGPKSPNTLLPFRPDSLSYPIVDGKYLKNPVLSYDYTPSLNPIHPDHPQGSVEKSNPNTPREFSPFWYGVKPTSLPLNYYSQDQPLNFEKVPQSQPQPEIWESPLPKNGIPSYIVPDDSTYYPKAVKPPVYYKSVFDYQPEHYGPYDFRAPDSLLQFPPGLTLYSSGDENYPSSDLPHNSPVLPYDYYTPTKSLRPTYPYNPADKLGDDTFDSNSVKLPVQYKPQFEYQPEEYVPIDSLKRIDSLVPFLSDSSLYPNNEGKYPSRPYVPQNPVSPYDYSPNSINPAYRYNSVPYPETNTHGFALYPFGAKPQPLPLKSNSLDAKNPLDFQNTLLPSQWDEFTNFPSVLPSVPNKQNENSAMVFEYPYSNQNSKYAEDLPFETNRYNFQDVNPKYDFSRPPFEPESKTTYISYSPDYTNSPTKPDFLEFPIVRPTRQPNPLPPYSYPVPINDVNDPSTDYQDTYRPDRVDSDLGGRHIDYPYGPKHVHSITPLHSNSHNFNHPDYHWSYYPAQLNSFEPQSIEDRYHPAKPEIFEFPYKPNNWSPDLLPNDPQIEHLKSPSFLHQGTDYIPESKAFVDKSLDNLHPDIPFLPNYPYRNKPTDIFSSYIPEWIPETSHPVPQDFFPNTSENILPASEARVLKFIEDAITVIEREIPLVHFDEPTLYIIAQIKNILVLKDVKADEYATLLDLYMKLINYIKQLNIYKQIIDRIDLSRVTNGSKLEAKKVVELTYLVKRPKPVVYYPYYYVKYRLPYHSFMLAAQKLLEEKPHLRMNPHQLYEKLLGLSKVVETSPDLESYDKNDILHLTFGSGSLVDAKLIGENGTLTNQLNVLRNLTSELAAENILDFNTEATNENETPDFETVNHHNDYQNEKNYIANNVRSDDRIESDPSSDVSNDSNLKNTYQNNINTYSTSEANLGFTTFDSSKLRRDILRGEYVGLPFSGYPIPTNINPLNGSNEPNSNSTIYNKLSQATIDADKLREPNQQNLMNSNGLLNHDNERISMNTGNANHQHFVKISNPKIMINTAKSVQSLVNSGQTQPGSGFSSQQMVNTAVELNPQNSASQQNMIVQQNYYNNDGLVNLDNQKISMNTGSQNIQDHVDIENPKLMLNLVTNSQANADAKSSQANADQFEAINNLINDEINQQNVINTGASPHTQQGSDMPYNYVKPSSVNSPSDSVSFVKPKIDATRNVAEHKQSWPDYGNPNKQEMENYIKNTVEEDFRDFYNTGNGKINGEEEKNKQNINDFNYFHNNMRPNDEANPINQDLANVNKFGASPGSTDSQLLDVDKSKQVITPEDDNQNQVQNENVMLNTNAAAATNVVSFNEQNLALNPDFGYHGVDASNAGAVKQSYDGIVQQNVATMLGHQAVISQNNFANYGAYPRLYGQQISKFFSMPIYNRQPVVQRFPVMSSTMPFVTRYTPMPYVG